MSTHKRMTINLSPEMADAVRELADGEGVAISEAIRRAIGTEQFLRKERREGGRILIEKGNNVREIVLR